jgi:hypothetical protein
LETVGAKEVTVSSGPAFVDRDDRRLTSSTESWVALLPSLDPTVMGWKQRDWYLGHHREAIFDRNGNPGPTVWLDGRIVGGWAQKKSGRIVYRLLEDVGSETADRINVKAESLQTWLGSTVVTPRFRGPLERTLATS